MDSLRSVTVEKRGGPVTEATPLTNKRRSKSAFFSLRSCYHPPDSKAHRSAEWHLSPKSNQGRRRFDTGRRQHETPCDTRYGLGLHKRLQQPDHGDRQRLPLETKREIGPVKKRMVPHGPYWNRVPRPEDYSRSRSREHTKTIQSKNGCRIRNINMWNIITVGICLLLYVGFGTCESIRPYRSLFIRMREAQLSTIPLKTVTNTTVEDCGRYCVQETTFECKSFDYDNFGRNCRLHNYTHTDYETVLMPRQQVDHYRPAYEKLFHRLPNHVVTLQHNLKVPGVSVEECARRCILETRFNCRGFDYERKLKNCWLTEATPESVKGVQVFANADYYERIPEGPLSKFVNYGFGSLRPLEGVQLYNKIVLGLTLDACARLCLAEHTFKCVTFDYLFADQSCHMSKYIAANVHGIAPVDDNNFRVMHYELKEEYLEYFYPTPYSVVFGNNEKTYDRVTPNRCARNCLEETSIVCRSFDYQIREGTCMLSSKTGSDVGGLYNQGFAQVHHFELKPFLDCGGFFNRERGNLASPNWPRNYPHNLHCEWVITVPVFKVVRLVFTHFDLGYPLGDPCSTRNDRLLLQERVPGSGLETFCAGPHTKEITSKTNNISLVFITDSNHDAPGFRVFYNAEWPCNTVLTRDNGEFATPNWPNNYPGNTDCHWLVRGPTHSRIILRFTKIELENHGLGLCNNRLDSIQVYDGENPNESERIATLCGSRAPTAVDSTSNVLLVVFRSDERVELTGFHATYRFVYPTVRTTADAYRDDRSSRRPALPPLPPQVTSSDRMAYTTTYTPSGLPDTLLTSQQNISKSRIVTTTTIPTTPPFSSEKSLTAAYGEPTKFPLYAESEKFVSQAIQTTRHVIDINGPVENESPVGDHNIIRIERTYRSTLWGLAGSLFILLVAAVIVLVAVCRYYRKRLPKRRNNPNFPFTEENVSLYEKENMINGQGEDTEFQPVCTSAVPDTAFSNPMYEERNSRQQLLSSDTSTRC